MPEQAAVELHRRLRELGVKAERFENPRQKRVEVVVPERHRDTAFGLAGDIASYRKLGISGYAIGRRWRVYFAKQEGKKP